MNVHKFIANLKRKSYYSNSWGIEKVVFSCGALWLMVYFIRGFFLFDNNFIHCVFLILHYNL